MTTDDRERARRFMSRWDSPTKDISDDEHDLAAEFAAVREAALEQAARECDATYRAKIDASVGFAAECRRAGAMECARRIRALIRPAK